MPRHLCSSVSWVILVNVSVFLERGSSLSGNQGKIDSGDDAFVQRSWSCSSCLMSSITHLRGSSKAKSSFLAGSVLLIRTKHCFKVFRHTGLDQLLFEWRFQLRCAWKGYAARTSAILMPDEKTYLRANRLSVILWAAVHWVSWMSLQTSLTSQLNILMANKWFSNGCFFCN